MEEIGGERGSSIQYPVSSMAAGIETGRSSAIVSSSKELYQYRIVSWTDSICAGLAIDRWRTRDEKGDAVCCLLSAVCYSEGLFDVHKGFCFTVGLIDSIDLIILLCTSKRASKRCTFWKWKEQTVQQLTTRTHQSGVSEWCVLQTLCTHKPFS